MRSWKTLAIALLAASQTAAQAPDPRTAFHDAAAHAEKPTATVAYGAGRLRMADLRVPPGDGPFPVAIIIHGGCWLAAMDTKAGIAAVAEALAKRGIATWTIEYSRIGDADGGWPGTFRDVAAAEDKLADVAKLFHLDLNRVTIVGHSAGAHLALWAASRGRLPAPWTGTRVHPRSVVAIDGPGALIPFIGTDEKACGQPVIVPLMGGTPDRKPAEYKIASPADHLPLGVKQLLVGGVFADLMRPYAAAARRAGDTVEMIEPPGANHFDIVTPSTPNGAAVIDFIATKAF